MLAADETFVERRKEDRIPFATTLTLRILGDAPIDIEGQMLDVSADGMRFLSPCAVAPSSAIRIDRPDGMILGEVCYCAPAPGNQFYLGVLFRQVLSNLRDLEPILRTLQSYNDEDEAKAKESRRPSSR